MPLHLHIFDPKAGGKVRTVLLVIASVGALAASAANDIAAAGGVLTVPVVIGIITHYLKLGNVPALTPPAPPVAQP